MKKILSLLENSREQCLAQVINDPAVKTCLATKGYELSENYKKDYDYVFMMQDQLTAKNLERYRNIICFERVAGTRLSKRKELFHPNLKRLVKMYRLTSADEYNRPCIAGRLFLNQIDAGYENERTVPEPAIGKVEYDKISCGPTLIHYKMHDRLFDFIRRNPIKPWNERRTDMFFAGTTVYGKGTSQCGKILTSHRAKCLDVMRKIKGKNILMADSTKYPIEEYYSLMNDTKFAISPWGWGDVCHRDYEALVLGCELVRPKLEYEIRSYCNIGQYGLFVSPDFSDIETIFDAVKTKDNINCDALYGSIRNPDIIVDNIILKLLE